MKHQWQEKLDSTTCKRCGARRVTSSETNYKPNGDYWEDIYGGFNPTFEEESITRVKCVASDGSTVSHTKCKL